MHLNALQTGSITTTQTPLKNPQGPDTGQRRVHRGGGWGSGTDALRVAERPSNYPSVRSGSYGFRCVIDVDADGKVFFILQR